jgi:hypothetical protein
LETAVIEIKDLKYKLDHSSHYTVLSPSCEACLSLKGKLFHATKENTKLQQEVAYLTACLKKIILSEKIIEDDLSRVEESATKPTYRLNVGFERCDDKGENNAPKFIPSSTYHKETPKPREKDFICMFCSRADHLDEFCFRRKRIERRRVEYARNSYRDEFIDFPPCSYSCILPRSYSRASPRTF